MRSIDVFETKLKVLLSVEREEIVKGRERAREILIGLFSPEID